MKTALFTGVFRDRPLEDAARVAAEVGYDGLELRALSHLPPGSTMETVRQVKHILQTYGLQAPVIYSNIGGGYASGTEEQSAQKLEQLKPYMEWAAELGTGMICHTPGGPSPDKAAESDYDRAALWMARAADECAKYGLRLIMEIHHNGMVETIDSSLKLVDKIGRPNVGLILDPGNMAIADEPYGTEAVQRLGAHIFHVHTKDVLFFAEKPEQRKTGQYRNHIYAVELMGKGNVDHRPAYLALKAAGYDGFISFEAQVQGATPEETAAHEYRMFRRAVDGE